MHLPSGDFEIIPVLSVAPANLGGVTDYAYFGPAGTFTEMALERLLIRRGESDARRIPAGSPAATLAAVIDGTADYACVPIESSLEGSVSATMDALVPPPGRRELQVVGEVSLDIAFTIAAATALSDADVRTIAAYPVASAQVRRAVERRFPNAEFVLAASNAAAAQDVAAGRADAAVTTPPAAVLSGLVPLAEQVADADDAVTRFLLVGRPAEPPARTGADRTSVILELPNEPGSLIEAMTEFASRGVDLTRIESRPRGGEAGGGSYRFFLDAVGHIDDEAVGEALRALYRRAERVVYLGSWPADGRVGTLPPDHGDSRRWFESLRHPEER